MPVGECISHMAPNTATEDALLELYTILSRAGAQLYLFDDVIAFICRDISLLVFSTDKLQPVVKIAIRSAFNKFSPF